MIVYSDDYYFIFIVWKITMKHDIWKIDKSVLPPAGSIIQNLSVYRILCFCQTCKLWIY